ncbi:MAG: hypothetical protein ACW986_16285 [Promethearchaeota archaeon]|jgi:hypothetical protein
MFLLNNCFNNLLIGSLLLILRITVLSFSVITIFIFFKKSNRAQKNSPANKFNNEDSKSSENKKKKKIKVRTNVIEEPEQSNTKRRDSITKSTNLNEQIEKITLKILYEEKSVITIKILNDKVLEQAARQKITVSEKIINSIIHHMHKIGKIEFTQKEGWKIRI